MSSSSSSVSSSLADELRLDARVDRAWVDSERLDRWVDAQTRLESLAQDDDDGALQTLEDFLISRPAPREVLYGNEKREKHLFGGRRGEEFGRGGKIVEEDLFGSKRREEEDLFGSKRREEDLLGENDGENDKFAEDDSYASRRRDETLEEEDLYGSKRRVKEDLYGSKTRPNEEDLYGSKRTPKEEDLYGSKRRPKEEDLYKSKRRSKEDLYGSNRDKEKIRAQNKIVDDLYGVTNKGKTAETLHGAKSKAKTVDDLDGLKTDDEEEEYEAMLAKMKAKISKKGGLPKAMEDLYGLNNAREEDDLYGSKEDDDVYGSKEDHDVYGSKEDDDLYGANEDDDLYESNFARDAEHLYGKKSKRDQTTRNDDLKKRNGVNLSNGTTKDSYRHVDNFPESRAKRAIAVAVTTSKRSPPRKPVQQNGTSSSTKSTEPVSKARSQSYDWLSPVSDDVSSLESASDAPKTASSIKKPAAAAAPDTFLRRRRRGSSGSPLRERGSFSNLSPRSEHAAADVSNLNSSTGRGSVNSVTVSEYNDLKRNLQKATHLAHKSEAQYRDSETRRTRLEGTVDTLKRELRDIKTALLEKPAAADFVGSFAPVSSSRSSSSRLRRHSSSSSTDQHYQPSSSPPPPSSSSSSSRRHRQLESSNIGIVDEALAMGNLTEGFLRLAAKDLAGRGGGASNSRKQPRPQSQQQSTVVVKKQYIHPLPPLPERKPRPPFLFAANAKTKNVAAPILVSSFSLSNNNHNTIPSPASPITRRFRKLKRRMLNLTDEYQTLLEQSKEQGSSDEEKLLARLTWLVRAIEATEKEMTLLVRPMA